MFEVVLHFDGGSVRVTLPKIPSEGDVLSVVMDGQRGVEKVCLVHAVMLRGYAYGTDKTDYEFDAHASIDVELIDDCLNQY